MPDYVSPVLTLAIATAITNHFEYLRTKGDDIPTRLRLFAYGLSVAEMLLSMPKDSYQVQTLAGLGFAQYVWQ